MPTRNHPSVRAPRIRRCALAACAAGALAVAPGCASHTTHAPATTTGTDREAVIAAFAAWRAGTGGPFDLLSPDATWTIVGSSPHSRTYRSKEEFFAEVIRPFNARLTAPLVPTVRGTYADGDTVVVFFDGAATAKDGLPYRNTYTWYLRFENGRVVEVFAFFDTRTFDEFWNRVAPSS